MEHSQSDEINKAIEITLVNGFYEISFSYDPDIVEAIKKVPERRYDPESRIWTVPVEVCSVNRLRNHLAKVAEVRVIESSEKNPDKTFVQPEKTPQIPLPQEFLDHLARRRYSRSTVKNYSHHFRQFMLFTKKECDFSDDDIPQPGNKKGESNN